LTSICEIKALIGLLYLAGVICSKHINTNDLWARDGTGIELFCMVMSQKIFLFSLSHLKFDDHDTRGERKFTDNFIIHCRRESSRSYIVQNCQTCYSTSEYPTIDEKLEGYR
jgi:hypothetical protein